ncbi:MAG: type IV secretory system conjugative DNA transfer family protein, partial [Coxiellaceae bacterium]|nr:type IV secretory system conjugative DNA transfer family protein [Coxiellaceae bacterium]
ERLIGFHIGVLYFLLGLAAFSMIDVIRIYDFAHHQHMPLFNPHNQLAVLYFIAVLIGLVSLHYYRIKNSKGNLYVITLCIGVFFGALLGGITEFLIQMYFAKIVTQQMSYSFPEYFKTYIANQWPVYLMMSLLLIMVLIIRWRSRVYKLSVQRDSQDTSSNLGSSRMASAKDITNYGLRLEVGSLIGKDDKGYIRMNKLTDRLILAYRGGGKTSSLLVPFILDNLHINKLITDIKGELCAITARKAIDADRDVYVIDPFQVLKTMGLNIKTHSINPLAYVHNKDPLLKDRYISALSAALYVVDQEVRSETESHFSENAQIILEGVLDFYTDQFFDQPEKMNLVDLHDWWIDLANDTEDNVIKKMKQGSNKARAAAAQLLVAGGDESGSMKTTVYRQLQWLRSDNVRAIFKQDEIDLSSFVGGQCDIYVVLPEDMIKSYSRMVRVVMALIKVKLIQSPTAKLKQDYCFVLDELGQFGYSPDVEQVINTMRSRGVKVWASFQTIGQVEVYRDDAIFKGMPVKHFLGSDDIKTLEWIQKLGDKTTVLTENVSRNASTAYKGARSSLSESYSVSETATDLIHFNDVREMPEDEQYVFIRGMRPIRCKKAYYFNEPIYSDKYDANPLENRGER